MKIKPVPKIDDRDLDRIKDEAHAIWLNGSVSVNKCWFDAVWNHIQRMGYEITKPIDKEAQLKALDDLAEETAQLKLPFK